MLSARIPDFDSELETLRSMAPAGFVMVFGFSFTGTEFVHYEYDEAWRKIYEKNNFFAVDPAFIWCMSRTGNIRWSEINLPDVRGVFQSAKAFDMNYGACLVRTSGTKRSLFALAHNEREFSDAEIAYFDGKFSTWVPLIMESEHLTEGELDVLRGLNRGLGQRDIAVELGISESTVKQRAISACKKLNAKTRAQAVGLAASRNYL